MTLLHPSIHGGRLLTILCVSVVVEGSHLHDRCISDTTVLCRSSSSRQRKKPTSDTVLRRLLQYKEMNSTINCPRWLVSFFPPGGLLNYECVFGLLHDRVASEVIEAEIVLQDEVWHFESMLLSSSLFNDRWLPRGVQSSGRRNENLDGHGEGQAHMTNHAFVSLYLASAKEVSFFLYFRILFSRSRFFWARSRPGSFWILKRRNAISFMCFSSASARY